MTKSVCLVSDDKNALFFFFGKRPLWNHKMIPVFVILLMSLITNISLRKKLKDRMGMIKSFKQAFNLGDFSKVSGTRVKWEVSYHLFNRL